MRITIDTQKDSPEHILRALEMIRKLVSETPSQATYSNTPTSNYPEDNLMGSLFNSAQPQTTQKQQSNSDYSAMGDDILESVFASNAAQQLGTPKPQPQQKPQVRVYEY